MKPPRQGVVPIVPCAFSMNLLSANPTEEDDSPHGSIFAEGMELLDDAQVIEATRYPACRASALTELARRRRYEASQSGTWKSGPDSPVPYPPQRYAQFRPGSWGGYRAMAPHERRRSWR